MHHHGLGVLERCGIALQWYEGTANKGEWIYDFDKAVDEFVNENFDSALLIYEKLAEYGFKTAQFNVAWIYDNHLQSDKYLTQKTQTSEKKAFDYYKLAADQGNEHAHLRLGDFYYYGDDSIVPVSYSLARMHYRVISKTNAQALYNLGYIHQHGIGVVPDRSIALEFYRSAIRIDQESILACTLSIYSLAIDFIIEKYNNNQLHEILPAFYEYLQPNIFTIFMDELEKGKTISIFLFLFFFIYFSTIRFIRIRS